jgi:Oxidoreductase family, C-terminal alpha/beta domain
MLLGEISHISAMRAPQRQRGMEGDDTSIAIVRFTSGAVATIVESYSAITPVTDEGGELHTLRIDGSMGTITYQGGGVVHLFSSPQRARGSSIQETVDVGQNDTFQAEIAHFLHCVQHRQEPITSGRSQRRPLELVLAAYQSMDSGGLSLIDVPPGKAASNVDHELLDLWGYIVPVLCGCGESATCSRETRRARRPRAAFRAFVPIIAAVFSVSAPRACPSPCRAYRSDNTGERGNSCRG